MVSNDTIYEVIEAILDQGRLTKSQVLEGWGVAEEDYRDLQLRVLQDGRILLGPQRAGGFVAKSSRSRRSIDEGSGDPLVLCSDWEAHAVERLISVLSKRDLEEALGDLKGDLRRSRYHERRVDRPNTMREMAVALVLQYGVDLFCNSFLRSRIAHKCRVPELKRWHPGKQAAIEFVERTGFPHELSGIPSPDTLPDYEYLEETFKLPRLLDFQDEVKRKLQMTLCSGERAIMTLPTGAGKTRVAVESILDWLTTRYDRVTRRSSGSAVLWLAHTEELCEQAYACFKQVWHAASHACPLLLVRFWGKYTQDLVKHRPVVQRILQDPSVLISTPQRIVNLLRGQIQESEPTVQDLRSAIGLLLIDEAHRAAAPSYRIVLNDLVPSDRDVSVTGLTATPFRMEYLGDDPDRGTHELKEIFRELIEATKILGKNARQRLQERGILARPVFRTIETPTAIAIPNLPDSDHFSADDIERVDRIMAQKADRTERRLAILRELLPIAADARASILYFGPSVRDAQCMAYLLRREAIPAAVVSATTRDVTRRRVIAEFKDKRIRVLCNCNVLTTGFDAPKVTHIVMARPTVSRVLYEQILGRGLRGPAFGGTETCTILDCKDNFKGQRPPLGYEAFRRVWEQETKGANPFTDVGYVEEVEAALQGSGYP